MVETGFAPGLQCQDLAAQGASYTDAVSYWYREGGPDRMDADVDGIPCETVYPAAEVEAYWSAAHPEVAVDNVARRLARCRYDVTHVVSTEQFPDGTHDVFVAVDLDRDASPDADGRFNVASGFDVIALDDASAALLACRS